MRLPACVALWLGLLAVPALAADPIMPLSDVERGMRCEGRTVFYGTAVETFEVEVLDVLEPSADAGAAILIRASGPRLGEGGLGYGFSGSPVYCRDSAGVMRNAGAVAAGLGDARNQVALATPIEDILGTPASVPPHARPATAAERSARPLATPLTLTGPGRTVRRAITAAARRHGIELLWAPGRASQTRAAGEMKPGSSVAAAISAGHIGLSGIGTVAYRDADAVWAFAHPFEGVGRRSLILQDAFVHAIVENAGTSDEGATTYKLASATRVAGTFGFDGLAAVGGLLGSPPPTILVHVDAAGPDGPIAASRSQVADESALNYPSGFPPLSLVASSAVADRAYTVLQSAAGASHGTLCTRIRVAERRRAMRFCNRYVGDGSWPGGPQDAMAADVAMAASLVEQFDRRQLHVERVRASLELRHGIRFAVMRRASGPRRVRPGQRIRLRLVVQRPRQRAQQVSFRYRVPHTVRPGRRTLRLIGTSADPGESSLAGVFGGIFDFEGGFFGFESGPRPQTVRALARAVRAIERFDGVRATFRRPRAGEEDPFLSEIFGVPDAGHRAGEPVFRHPRLRIGGRATVRLRVLPRRR